MLAEATGERKTTTSGLLKALGCYCFGNFQGILLKFAIFGQHFATIICNVLKNRHKISLRKNCLQIFVRFFLGFFKDFVSADNINVSKLDFNTHCLPLTLCLKRAVHNEKGLT